MPDLTLQAVLEFTTKNLAALEQAKTQVRGLEGQLKSLQTHQRLQQRAMADVGGAAQALGLNFAALQSGPLTLLATGLRSLLGIAGQVAKGLLLVGGVTAGVAAALGLGLAKKVLDITSAFEQYELQLTTLYQSSDRAKQTFAWIQEFAKPAPFGVGELTQATIFLEIYGLTAQKWLPLVANWAAATGRQVEDAAMAAGKAMVGESERMKEMGITSEQLLRAGARGGPGGGIAAQGAENRKALETALESVLSQRFAGAMQRAAGTLKQTLSTLSDTWNQFLYKIGQSGFFTTTVNALKGLQTQLDKMAEAGKFDRLAAALSKVLSYLSAVASDLVTRLPDWVNWAIGLFEGVKAWLDANGQTLWDAVQQGAKQLWATLAGGWEYVKGKLSEVSEGLIPSLERMAYDVSHNMLTVEQSVLKAAQAWREYGQYIEWAGLMLREMADPLFGVRGPSKAAQEREKGFWERATQADLVGEERQKAIRDRLREVEAVPVGSRIAAGRMATATERGARGGKSLGDYIREAQAEAERIYAAPTRQAAQAPTVNVNVNVQGSLIGDDFRTTVQEQVVDIFKGMGLSGVY